MVKTLKWISTVLCLVGIALTSWNAYPYNVVFGCVGSAGWAYAGYKAKDYPLLLVELVAVLIYLAGIVKVINSL